MSRDWLGRTSPKWSILCRVGCKTLTSSISQSHLISWHLIDILLSLEVSVSEWVTLMCDGSARGWLASDTDRLAGWPVILTGWPAGRCQWRWRWCTPSRNLWELCWRSSIQIDILSLTFTAQHCAVAVYLSVCVSIRSRCSIKMVERVITDNAADSPRTLVSDAKDQGEVEMGSPPVIMPNARGV